MKALRELVDSGYEYGLILEDDFAVKNVSRFKRVLIEAGEIDWDICQIGFLNNGVRSKIDLLLANFESYFFVFLANLATRYSKFSAKVGNRLRVRRAQNIGFHFAVDDLRAGAHAYFIKTDIAKIILRDYENQKLLTTDGFLISTNWTRPFKSLRLKKSVVGQSNSKSSIRI
jgi:GR25 family glycosyltransferase involved in LPS biosynthesis